MIRSFVIIRSFVTRSFVKREMRYNLWKETLTWEKKTINRLRNPYTKIYPYIQKYIWVS